MMFMIQFEFAYLFYVFMRTKFFKAENDQNCFVVISNISILAIGFFNEADTLESSSVLIYSSTNKAFIHKNGGIQALLIK
jgi:hypothetical protein